MDDRSRPFSVTVSSWVLVGWVVQVAVFHAAVGSSILAYLGAFVAIALWVGLALSLSAVYTT